MNSLQRLPGMALTLALAAAVGVGAWWLYTNKPGAAKSEKPPGAATVDKVVKEEDLARIVVTEAAEKRLGLTIGAVESKPVRRVRVYGGEVSIPVGRTILVAAPLGGTLEAPHGGLPKPGQIVQKGDTVIRLLPLLTPEARITMSATLATAEGTVKTTEKRLETAQIALDRAKKAFTDMTGSKAALEAAQGAQEVAKEEHDAAIANKAVLVKAVGELEKGTASPIPVLAPQAGILRTISSLPGQTVPSGAALFEVLDLSTVWVRVPLPVGDLESVAQKEIALVGKLSASPGTTLTPASPVPAPPSANLLAGTVDVFFSLPNPGGVYTPGQRVGVTMPLNDPQNGLTVPWSAVVFDIHGSTWIFEETAARTFYRRRVVVKYTDPTNPAVAVLESGPKAGTRIVTKGVQELFGAETGFIK